MTRRALRREQGAAAVEFALAGSIAIVLLLAITGLAHWLYTLEILAEATRAGARMAVVCDLNDSSIKAALQAKVPNLQLQAAQVQLSYLPAGCTINTCQVVRVSISGATYTPWFPAGAASYPIPPFTTSLPRESMESVNAAGEINPVCS